VCARVAAPVACKPLVRGNWYYLRTNNILREVPGLKPHMEYILRRSCLVTVSLNFSVHAANHIPEVAKAVEIWKTDWEF
jgi:hypothetical protein